MQRGDSTSLTALRSDDSLPIEGASYTDLDEQAVRSHIEQAQRRGRYRGSDDPVAYLQAHGCIADHNGQVTPTIAGILCFGRNPEHIMAHAVVDIAHYHGVEPLSYEVKNIVKNIGGSLFEQLRRIEEYFRDFMMVGMTVEPGSLQRIEVPEYPYLAIREIAVNMLIHRDYRLTSASCLVRVYRDHTEWISPGGLVAGVTLDQIIGSTRTRNKKLSTILYQAGYVEAIGQGLTTVMAELQRAQMEPAQFHADHNFTVTVKKKQFIPSLALAGNTTLSSVQQTIVNYIKTRHDVTINEICRLFTNRKKRAIQSDLSALIELGILQRDGKGPATVYRIRES